MATAPSEIKVKFGRCEAARRIWTGTEGPLWARLVVCAWVWMLPPRARSFTLGLTYRRPT